MMKISQFSRSMQFDFSPVRENPKWAHFRWKIIWHLPVTSCFSFNLQFTFSFIENPFRQCPSSADFHFFLALAACEMVINARRGIYGLRQTGGGGRWVAQWPLSLKLCWLHSRWLHQQHCSYAPCNHEIISAANLAHFMSQQQQTPPTAKAKTTQ